MADTVNIEKIADLSMLTLSPAEQEEFRADLTEIIRFAEEISETNLGKNRTPETEGNRTNVFRDDVITNTENRAELLKNSGSNDGIYVKVPQVIGGKEK